MLFNSLDFAVFLSIVFFLYWFVVNQNLKLQNLLLLVASYFFYSCWDWRFLGLLAFSTLLDYTLGLKIDIEKNIVRRKIWLAICVGVNLGFLFLFKYYNFFVDSFSSLLTVIGFKVHLSTLNIILPVGISFYTFHGLSYIVDIYRGRISAEKNFVSYSLFVSFFPLLVAGPIERATHLLPQIVRKRSFNYYQAVIGLRQILWGLFKKIVIADNCAEYANLAFSNPEANSGSTSLLGIFFFTIQIYCDFSGYSDMALGTAKLLGFELLKNFNYPYFSRNIAEFWRRWHISLSSWFRDYLYIPLGGSKGNFYSKVRNVFIIFLVSGFWHGANWTFIVWGGINALFIIPSFILNKNRSYVDVVAKGKILPSLTELLLMLNTFLITMFAWIFFRSVDLKQAIIYLSGIFKSTIFSKPIFFPSYLFILIFFFFVIEWLGRENNFALEKISVKIYRPLRYSFYTVLILSILFFYGAEQQFIYFQF